jgi:hypothetical protein
VNTGFTQERKIQKQISEETLALLHLWRLRKNMSGKCNISSDINNSFDFISLWIEFCNLQN